MSEDRKERIEESKEKTRRRARRQTGHWAGDPEHNEADKLPHRREGYKHSGRFGSKSRGTGRRKSQFGGRHVATSYFPPRYDSGDDNGEVSYVAIVSIINTGENGQRPHMVVVASGAATASSAANATT